MGSLDKVKQGKGLWLLILGIAAGLLLILWDGKETKEDTSSPDPPPSASLETANDYLSALERQIGQLLEAMDGVSGVSVALMPDGTVESQYAQNGHYDGGSMTEREYLTVTKDGNGETVLIRSAGLPWCAAAAPIPFCRKRSFPFFAHCWISPQARSTSRGNRHNHASSRIY